MFDTSATASCRHATVSVELESHHVRLYCGARTVLYCNANLFVPAPGHACIAVKRACLYSMGPILLKLRSTSQNAEHQQCAALSEPTMLVSAAPVCDPRSPRY